MTVFEEFLELGGGIWQVFRSGAETSKNEVFLENSAYAWYGCLSYHYIDHNNPGFWDLAQLPGGGVPEFWSILEYHTNHEKSDACGIIILVVESDPFWHDRKSTNQNGNRTDYLIRDADIVVIRFGKK